LLNPTNRWLGRKVKGDSSPARERVALPLIVRAAVGDRLCSTILLVVLVPDLQLQTIVLGEHIYITDDSQNSSLDISSRFNHRRRTAVSVCFDRNAQILLRDRRIRFPHREQSCRTGESRAPLQNVFASAAGCIRRVSFWRHALSQLSSCGLGDRSKRVNTEFTT
jgi:hypothetical protein